MVRKSSGREDSTGGGTILGLGRRRQRRAWPPLGLEANSCVVQAEASLQHVLNDDWFPPWQSEAGLGPRVG